jgi:hypothetical protein|tara:strand:- start:865 stop:1482 length:618 start_codon:yes stop_codon:yes gene_type:complete
MEKNTLVEIRSDIKAKRDSLSLAHESLKIACDHYNKLIIFISLGSSLFESAKMTLGWDDPFISLVPIFLSSIVAGISSYIKFKNYSERQEIIIQAATILTSTLSKARNCSVVDADLLKEYHTALELLETSLYPDIRRKFLKASQKNLVSIIATEDKYFNVIDTAKNGGKLKDVIGNLSDSSTDDIIGKPTTPEELEEGLGDEIKS